MRSTVSAKAEVRVGISVSPTQLHLRVVWTRTSFILILIDDTSAASQGLTSSLEVCHSFGRKHRRAVVFRRCVMAFVDWDSRVYHRWSDDLFFNHRLDRLMNYIRLEKMFQNMWKQQRTVVVNNFGLNSGGNSLGGLGVTRG